MCVCVCVCVCVRERERKREREVSLAWQGFLWPSDSHFNSGMKNTRTDRMKVTIESEEKREEVKNVEEASEGLKEKKQAQVEGWGDLQLAVSRGKKG